MIEGNSVTEELRDLYCNYDATGEFYEGIELSHPEFTNGTEYLLRYTTNKEFYVDGVKKLFQAFPMSVIPPKVGANNQDVSIVLDNVTNELIEQIELAAKTPDVPIKVRYFVFIDSSSVSQIDPITLHITNISASARVIQATATRPDLFKYRVPSKMYDSRFEGLMR